MAEKTADGTTGIAETLTDGQRIGSLRGVAFGTRRVRVPGPDGTPRQSPPIDIRTTLDVPIISKVDLGYGGYIDRAYINQALRQAAERAAVFLPGFSPVAIESAGLNEEWAMTTVGRVTADLPLFPGFEFGVRAEGNAIFIDAPIPVDRLRFDPFRGSVWVELGHALDARGDREAALAAYAAAEMLGEETPVGGEEDEIVE